MALLRLLLCDVSLDLHDGPGTCHMAAPFALERGHPMTPDPTTQPDDREQIARVLWRVDDYDLDADPNSRTAREMRPEYLRRADAVLAWLADRDTGQAQRALTELVALKDGPRDR